jgi:hypothetical protein
MAKKIDIFEVLRKIDACDIAYFQNLDEEEMKSVQPLVIMRWMSGTKDSTQIQRINALTNSFVFSLQKEKMLLIKLLMASSTSKKTYKWYGKKSSVILPKSNVEIVMDYYTCSKKEAVEAVKLLSKDDILALAIELGYQKEDMTGIK